MSHENERPTRVTLDQTLLSQILEQGRETAATLKELTKTVYGFDTALALHISDDRAAYAQLKELRESQDAASLRLRTLEDQHIRTSQHEKDAGKAAATQWKFTALVVTITGAVATGVNAAINWIRQP